MKIKNTLAKNLETVDDKKVSLDTVCKKLLSHKSILARILKSCVKEYQDCSIWDIEEKYIEEVPLYMQFALHQDETVVDNGCIKGSRNEESSMTDGTVTYDIKFVTKKPPGKGFACADALAAMIINIEAQTDFYPGYPLVKRGIYYGSRLISSQYGTAFVKSHYEKIQKVYSIWICIHPPACKKNSINIYSFKEECLFGNGAEKEENYDLLSVIMIYLGNENDSAIGVIRLLSVLLSAKMSAGEKEKILETEFGIAMTTTMRKEAEEMCDYSKYVEERGMEKGEALLASLLEKLYDDGREEDVPAVLRDKMKRKKYYQEYGLL